MLTKQNLPEKRKSYRLYAQIHVQCDIIDPRDKSVRTKNFVSNNINPEGIYLEADEALSLNTEVSVSFTLPKSDNRIQAQARIVRVEVLQEVGSFGLGLIFTKLQDKDKEEITQMIERLNIGKLLELAIKKGASDMHLLAEQQPVLRIHGDLEAVEGPKLRADEVPQILYSIMTRRQIKKFETDKELDFGIQHDMRNRFRINVHQQRGYTEATLRLINTKISSFEELNIPDIVKDLARQREGLVLIAGPTGSGKTTTIAAMIELINHERKAVVITLERPIEYVHSNVKCIIKQREVGIDTNSFSEAIKSTLKQDPNIIVIGELEDAETVKTALIAAEAGYLVIASFHSPSTVQAIDRLANFYPLEARKQALSQLSNCLKGIVTQLLIPRKDKLGRVLASEIVVATDAMKRLIRKDELIQLPTVIQTGGSFHMQSMTDSIRKYVDMDLIDAESAMFFSEEFNRYTSHFTK